MCVRFALYMYTQTRLLRTRVLEVVPEVKAYLDRVSHLIQSGAVFPDTCDEYSRIHYEHDVTDKCNMNNNT